MVLKNQNVGRQWNASFTLEKPFSKGLYVKGAYSYGEARNTVDPGSIAAGTWQSNPHSRDPNNPGIGLSSAFQGHRVFGTFSYSKDYFNFGGTTVSMFVERRLLGNGSYLFAGDFNGDSGTNDLIYVPRDASETNFSTITERVVVNGTPQINILFTPAQQAAAWDAYISQDPYLSTRRGQYAERGRAFLPYITRGDFSVPQDLFFKVKNTTQKFQVRVDVLNFGNLLNKNWGGGQAFNSLQPLVAATVTPLNNAASTATCRNATAQTSTTYCLRTLSGSLLSSTYQRTANTADVYRIQIGLRYIFNK